MVQRKVEKAWKEDEKGRKYIDLETVDVDKQGNLIDVVKKDYAEIGGTWALCFLTSCIKTTNGMARRTLEELEGLTEVEIRSAYINDKNHGGNEYLEIIKLGEVLKKASE